MFDFLEFEIITSSEPLYLLLNKLKLPGLFCGLPDLTSIAINLLIY